MKNIDKVKLFLVGVTLGGLMGISIKYPLKGTTYDEATKLCTDYYGINKVTVGLTGKIYVVTCNKDNKQFFIK